MSLTSMLFRAARASDDARAVRRTFQTGDPRYVVRRGKNIVVGRELGKAGVWKGLWK
jgi:hypothetical protein